MVRHILKMVFVFVMLVNPGFAFGHAMAPSLLKISEQGNNEFLVLWKQPIKQSLGTRLFPSISQCPDTQIVDSRVEKNALVQQLIFHCINSNGRNLEGRDIKDRKIVTITGINDSDTYVLVEWVNRNGSSSLGIINRKNTRFQLSSEHSQVEQFIKQVRSGVIHLWQGYDHILFIIGLLVILQRRLKALIIAFSCFTVGHTIALLLAAERLISLNPDFVEILILSSLLWMAIEVLANNKHAKYSIRSKPYLLTLAFGLIHGLGFANVLFRYVESQQDTVLQVLAFNLGVEVGQFMIVMIMYPVLLLISLKNILPGYNLALGYSVGGLAMYWLIQLVV